MRADCVAAFWALCQDLRVWAGPRAGRSVGRPAELKNQAGDANFAGGAAIPDPGANCMIPTDANTMEQLAYILIQLTEANLHAIENALRDGGPKNALKYRAAFFRQCRAPTAGGVAKTRIQKTATL